MRLLWTVPAMVLACSAIALAQPKPPPADWVPPGANPETGARPGNEIGSGMSLPLSDKAGNILPQTDGSPLAGRLPTPPVDENANARDFLLAARGALAAGRTGEAQEALERAETRLLDRSVPLFHTSDPVRDAMVVQIRGVLQSLGAGDRMQAMQQLERAIAMPAAAEPVPNAAN